LYPINEIGQDASKSAGKMDILAIVDNCATGVAGGQAWQAAP
jgi:hypothetical protein